MFICTKCGLCCRNIDKIPEFAKFDMGNGVCIHLSNDNLCNIYVVRPDICNIDRMYELFYKSILSKEEYERLNIEGCRALQNKQR